MLGDLLLFQAAFVAGKKALAPTLFGHGHGALFGATAHGWRRLVAGDVARRKAGTYCVCGSGKRCAAMFITAAFFRGFLVHNFSRIFSCDGWSPWFLEPDPNKLGCGLLALVLLGVLALVLHGGRGGLIAAGARGAAARS